MGKVSIGIRGWRFDEEEVFDDDGRVRPLEEMDPDTRQRLIRLMSVLGEPCDACYLIHGESDVEQCNAGQVVYGEPLGEVVLCDAHEPDFVYWFREAGGSGLAGHLEMPNGFHEWFADGNRAPEGYEGLDHVDRDPDGVPDPPDPEPEREPGSDPPDPEEAAPGIEDEMRNLDDEELEALAVDLDDLDF